MHLKHLLAASALFCSILGLASETQRGFVDIGADQQIYIDYQKGEADQPVLVILNALTYDTENWDTFVSALGNVKYGILRFDSRGQGRTLLKYAPARQAFPIEEQVEDLAALLRTLKVSGKVDLLGLSYGGGLAIAFASRYPQKVNSMILMAPFVGPIPDQDRTIRMQIASTRLMNPWNPATDDELYDYFLRLNIYATYPLAEPSILKNPYLLEATFRLVQGVRKMNVEAAVKKFPANSVHLLVAGRDQVVPAALHDKFWEEVPASAEVSRLNIADTEHKIPEAVPHYAAGWVNLIMNRDSRISGGKVFQGDPALGQAISGTTQILLPKEK